MSQHPYNQFPNSSFWKRSIAAISPEQVDPVVSGKFRIGPNDKVATAGSCFAQHIARHLKKSGFNYFVSENANSIVPENLALTYQYGTYTARYGNVYTPLQLIQLFKRAYGLFKPSEDIWVRADGRLIDPFRPQIQPHGFASQAEFDADRRQHFAAIRNAVENLDVFVFTLGLTETWISRLDGAAYPICPGVAGGTFDESKHAFLNMKSKHVINTLRDAIAFILERNSKARIILTVSPVPLVATAESHSVLVSTIYSKSVLRVAADEVCDGLDNIAYFPSYEIITGHHTRGRYFAEDLRSVTEIGVKRVMELFMKHYTNDESSQKICLEDFIKQNNKDITHHQSSFEKAISVICDEEVLDK